MVPSGLLVVGLEEELFPTLCSNADSEFINHTCRASYWSKTIKDIEVCPMFFHQNPPKTSIKHIAAARCSGRKRTVTVQRRRAEWHMFHTLSGSRIKLTAPAQCCALETVVDRLSLCDPHIHTQQAWDWPPFFTLTPTPTASCLSLPSPAVIRATSVLRLAWTFTNGFSLRVMQTHMR